MNSVKKIMLTLGLLFLLISINGCEKKIDNGISKVHWDRDMCARCVMVISDRNNAVQVKNPKTGKRYMFDDIGCMILWFKEDKIEWSSKALIWVIDIDTKKWIDARVAFYSTENITPMAYGFSAHSSKDAVSNHTKTIDYQEVTRRVLVK